MQMGVGVNKLEHNEKVPSVVLEDMEKVPSVVLKDAAHVDAEVDDVVIKDNSKNTLPIDQILSGFVVANTLQINLSATAHTKKFDG